MKCALCGGELSERLVTEEVREGNDHIMVKVKAEVCQQCHERYYASGVVDRLIHLKDNLGKRKVELHQIGRVYEAP